MDLGVMLEGVVEFDARNNKVLLRVQKEDGSDDMVDIQEEVLRHIGKEIRLICTPLDTIAEIARMVESGEFKL